MKPMTPSAALSEVVGTKPIPRTEVTKKPDAIHQEEQAADQEEQADDQGGGDALKTVFGGKATVNMCSR
jgi:hypothetical protein